MNRQPLSMPVYWRGRQWAVTGYGIECLTEDYALSRNLLWSKGDPLRRDNLGWLVHLSRKKWVDLADFEEAIRFAVKLWSGPQPAKETRAQRFGREMDEQWRARYLLHAGEGAQPRSGKSLPERQALANNEDGLAKGHPYRSV